MALYVRLWMSRCLALVVIDDSREKSVIWASALSAAEIMSGVRLAEMAGDE
jgi:hypothetical protein